MGHALLKGTGIVAGVPLSPLVGAGALSAQAGKNMLSSAANTAGEVVQRAFTNNPLATSMATLGGGAGMYFTGKELTNNLQGMARTNEAGRLIQQGVQNTPMGGNMGFSKLSSSVLSQSDFDSALRVRRQLEKVASLAAMSLPKGGGKSWGPKEVLLAAALVGSVGTGVGIAQQAGSRAVGTLGEKMRAKTRQKRYDAMLRADPSLKDEPLARTYFAVLDRASPYMSGEPHLAAATVQNMISTPALREGGVPSISAKQIQEILNTEQVRQGTRFPTLQTKAPQGPALKDLGSFDMGV